MVDGSEEGNGRIDIPTAFRCVIGTSSTPIMPREQAVVDSNHRLVEAGNSATLSARVIPKSRMKVI